MQHLAGRSGAFTALTAASQPDAEADSLRGGHEEEMLKHARSSQFKVHPNSPYVYVYCTWKYVHIHILHIYIYICIQMYMYIVYM